MRCCGRLFLGGVLLCCLLSGARAADQATIESLIRQLGDHDFARREAALVELCTRGPEAIDQLVAAAVTESPEVASRAVQILERLMTSEDATLIDAADAALVALTESEQPHAIALATAVLERNTLIREQRAVAQIRKLGGQVQYDLPRDEFRRPLVDPADPAADRVRRPHNIILSSRWQGGTSSLSVLRKLSHVSNVQLYVVNGCGVSIAEAQSLASVLPGLIAHKRGPYLGVQASSDRSPCEVSDAPQHGPAFAAGIREQDTILALDNQPIALFNDLVAMLIHRNVGDDVTIRVVRAGRVLDIKVRLGEWNLPPIAYEPDVPAPGPGGLPPAPFLPARRPDPFPRDR